MKKKLNCVLLIDDDYPTNFYHKIVLNNAECTKHIVAYQSALDALEYLRGINQGTAEFPNLVFLDINMPAMNGWEFLEAYKTLPESCRAGIVLVMLSTSNNAVDVAKAAGIKEVAGFVSKPLSEEIVKDVLDKYFSDSGQRLEAV